MSVEATALGIAAIVGMLVAIVTQARSAGKEKAGRRMAGEGVSDAKTVDEITGEALPTDPDAALDLLRDR